MFDERGEQERCCWRRDRSTGRGSSSQPQPLTFGDPLSIRPIHLQSTFHLPHPSRRQHPAYYRPQQDLDLRQTANAAGIKDPDPSAAGSRRSTLGTRPPRLPAHSVDKSSSFLESRVTRPTLLAPSGSFGGNSWILAYGPDRLSFGLARNSNRKIPNPTLTKSRDRITGVGADALIKISKPCQSPMRVVVGVGG